MSASDILTIFTIFFAIAAFISEKSRTYVFLKFNKVHLLIYLSAFLYVHFLVVYDWFYEKFQFLNFFYWEGWPTSSAWAYIISLALMIWAMWKVFKGFYPSSNRVRVIRNYNDLLLKGEISFLAELIEKFHLNDIIEYLRKKRTIKREDIPIFTISTEYDKRLSKLINTNKLLYAADVYTKIVLNDIFLDHVSKATPVIFAPIIAEMSSRDVKDEKFVNRYLKNLTENKNGLFFREIRATQYLTEHEAYIISPDTPILYALFNNIQVASVNNAWRGIGEEALQEMEEEARKDFSPLRLNENEQDKDTIWSYRMQNAIHFFDIMIRQAIEQDSDFHMWMYYYPIFIKVIDKNMPDLPVQDLTDNRNSRNYNMISLIFENMMSWKNVILSSGNTILLKDLFKCMGQCLYRFATKVKLNVEDKNELIDWVWMDLIENTYSEHENAEQVVAEVLEHGFNMFKRPDGAFSNQEEKRMYVQLLQNMWNKRDSPRITGETEERANKFKTEILNPLLEQITE